MRAPRKHVVWVRAGHETWKAFFHGQVRTIRKADGRFILVEKWDHLGRDFPSLNLAKRAGSKALKESYQAVKNLLDNTPHD